MTSSTITDIRVTRKPSLSKHTRVQIKICRVIIFVAGLCACSQVPPSEPRKDYIITYQRQNPDYNLDPILDNCNMWTKEGRKTLLTADQMNTIRYDGDEYVIVTYEIPGLTIKANYLMIKKRTSQWPKLSDEINADVFDGLINCNDNNYYRGIVFVVDD